MYYNNRKVTSTYASTDTQNAYAIITGIAGWLKIKTTSVDGVSNLFVAVNSALANNRTVDVYVVANQIERVVMK